MSAAEPAQAPEPDAIEGEIDEVLAEFGGDARAAIRALLSTTMGYDRGAIVQTSRVAELRMARRKKAENEG